MRILLSRAAYTDTNFNVGLGLVVIFAAIEIFSASFYYMGRIRAARMSAQPAIATMERHVSASPAPTLTQPEASPAPAASPSAPSEVDRLVQQATTMSLIFQRVRHSV